MSLPKIVSQEEWTAARRALLAKEKKFKGVIIPADAPHIEPYRARDMTTIHNHETSGTATRSSTTG